MTYNLHSWLIFYYKSTSTNDNMINIPTLDCELPLSNQLYNLRKNFILIINFKRLTFSCQIVFDKNEWLSLFNE